MQTKIKIYVSIGILCLFAIFGGCGWKKEILLEHSQSESVSQRQDAVWETDNQQSLEAEETGSSPDGSGSMAESLPELADAEPDLIYVHVCGRS